MIVMTKEQWLISEIQKRERECEHIVRRLRRVSEELGYLEELRSTLRREKRKEEIVLANRG